MALQILEVTSDADFDLLIPLLWVSYENPRIPFLPLLFPAEDGSPEAKAKAIQLSKMAMVKLHHSDPSSHWLKVVDTATGEIIAGARWHIHETDPYSNAEGHDFVAPFYPDGDRKNYASLNIGAIVNPRRVRYTRPHTNLQVCFVHPEHRRRGAGKLIMNWGIERTDQLNLDSFVEATELGCKLYDRYGFILVSKDEVNTSVAAPTDEWKDMEARFKPIPWYCMWRPKHGKPVEPGTPLPW